MNLDITPDMTSDNAYSTALYLFAQQDTHWTEENRDMLRRIKETHADEHAQADEAYDNGSGRWEDYATNVIYRYENPQWQVDSTTHAAQTFGRILSEAFRTHHSNVWDNAGVDYSIVDQPVTHLVTLRNVASGLNRDVLNVSDARTGTNLFRIVCEDRVADDEDVLELRVRVELRSWADTLTTINMYGKPQEGARALASLDPRADSPTATRTNGFVTMAATIAHLIHRHVS